MFLSRLQSVSIEDECPRQCRFAGRFSGLAPVYAWVLEHFLFVETLWVPPSMVPEEGLEFGRGVRFFFDGPVAASKGLFGHGAFSISPFLETLKNVAKSSGCTPLRAARGITSRRVGRTVLDARFGAGLKGARVNSKGLIPNNSMVGEITLRCEELIVALTGNCCCSCRMSALITL